MKPNIIFIVTDQQKYDTLGCTGNSVIKTPNLDKLGEEGVIFTNAYTPSPVCGPARAAIFTGRYPPGAGVVKNNTMPIRGDAVLFTERLQNLGYMTAQVGKLHFVPYTKRYGFKYKRLHDSLCRELYGIHEAEHSDYLKFLQRTKYKKDPDAPIRLFEEDEKKWFEKEYYQFIMGSNWREEKYHSNTWVAEESIKFLENNQEFPFFLHISFFGPHQPYQAPSPWNEMYKPDEIELPPQFYADTSKFPIFQKREAKLAFELRSQFDIPTYKKIIAANYGQISMIDHYIGKIFQKLKEKGLWNNTFIIFAPDHGDHLGAYGLFFKGEMYDSCCKVPLIIKPLRSSQKGRRINKIVNTLDLYGTILEIAGDSNWKQEEPTPWKSYEIESRSLLPLIQGKEVKWNNETFSIIGTDPNSNLTMYRKDNLKLCRLAIGEKEAVYEMFDMAERPVEMRNIFEEKKYRKEKENLKEKLDRWWQLQKEKYPKY